MSYIDTLSGGSISKLGIFSLGIVPFINSSIIFQLLSSAIPSLEKLQKEEGIAGRRKFQQYQRYGALGFAVVQAVGQVRLAPPSLTVSLLTLCLPSPCLRHRVSQRATSLTGSHTVSPAPPPSPCLPHCGAGAVRAAVRGRLFVQLSRLLHAHAHRGRHDSHVHRRGDPPHPTPPRESAGWASPVL
jgi:hypothetical protein